MPDVTGPSDRLLGCVLDLLVAEGYEGISIRRVATAAGVSIGAVQHHFATKDALLAAAMDRVSQQFRERLERRIAPGAGPGGGRGAGAAGAGGRVSQQCGGRRERRIAPGAGPGEWLRAVADELVSTGEERRPASVIWL